MQKKSNRNISPKKPVASNQPANKEERKNNLIPIIILVLVTIICFSNSLNNDFTNWDDPGYVIDNPLVKSLSSGNIKEMFKTPVQGNYHPLTILSLALDYKVNQLNPFGYHFSNLLFHLLNVILAFVFVRMLTGRMLIAFIVALFFGIHPMHVESVSWISERKDVLYVLWYLASLCTWLFMLRTQRNQTIYYSLTVIFFIFSLLSKAQAVTLPLVLLLIDYFKERKLSKKLILEKLPFFLIAIVMGVIALKAQKMSGAIAEMPAINLYERFLFASYAFIIYVYKLFLPFNLSTYYPYPEKTGNSFPTIFYIAPILLLGLIFIVVKYFSKNKSFVFGFVFFILNIILLLQILPVGSSILSERYTYLAYIGLFFIIGYLFDKVWYSKVKNESKYKYLFAGGIFLFAIFLSVNTVARNKVWKNSETLWTDVLNQFPRVVIALCDRGNYYKAKDKEDLAFADFDRALQINPDHVETLINRAEIYRLRGQLELSLADCNRAINVNPKYNGAYVNRGIVYCMTSRLDDAMMDFNKAALLDPNFSSTYCDRGNLYDMKGMLDSAIIDYTKAIQLKPDYAEAFYNRGKTYFRKQEFDAALNDFNAALKIRKNYFGVYFYRSKVYKARKDYQNALNDALYIKESGQPIDENYIVELRNLLQ